MIAGPSGTQASPDSPMHWGSDRSKMNRKTKWIELRGNAYLMRDNEVVYADEMDLNMDAHKVYARGRVRYQYGDYFIRADAIYLDLLHKTGTVTNGNLTNGLFALRGSSMEQIGEQRYLVKDYNYTTCHDCPNSWEMTGKEVDFTIEGYAHMTDFVFKVKDSSFFWLPYLVVPIKNKRQSGFLFPRFGINDIYGSYVVEPYFWAVNDWSDMTAGAGYYAKRGNRFEWEGRYALTQRSQGTSNFYLIKDKELAAQGLSYRYAGKVSLTQELPYGFEGKLRFNEVSDSGYPNIYYDDIPGRYEPVLPSDLFFSKNDPSLSTVVSFRRLRNLLYFSPDPTLGPGNYLSRPGFDPNTVQEFPRIVLNSNDQFIFDSKVAAGVEARFNRFTRQGGAYDLLPDPTSPGKGNYPSKNTYVLREANRFTLTPGMYTTLNPWPWLSVVPSVQYRSYFYNFNGSANNLTRGYLLGQVESSLQLEKVYQTGEPDVSYRHIIRPTLTYSNIPTVQLSSPQHPFITQQESANPGQYFDDSDIVPLGNTQNLDTYFVPLGNSLTYGFVTQFFRKDNRKGLDPVVSKRFELSATQTLDIREAQRFLNSGQREDRVILSPVFTHANYTDGKFYFNTDYIYYAFLDRYKTPGLLAYTSPHRFNATVAVALEGGVHQEILKFDRSMSVSYAFSKLTSKQSYLATTLNYSINDYILPTFSIAYNLVTNNTAILSSKYGLILQSPSRCWRVESSITSTYGLGTGFNLTFALNLTGSSFGTLDQNPK